MAELSPSEEQTIEPQSRTLTRRNFLNKLLSRQDVEEQTGQGKSPLPAKEGMTRRSFNKMIAGLVGVLFGSYNLPGQVLSKNESKEEEERSENIIFAAGMYFDGEAEEDQQEVPLEEASDTSDQKNADDEPKDSLETVPTPPTVYGYLPGVNPLEEALKETRKRQVEKDRVMPKDTISPEELSAHHINISPTKEIGLLLREAAKVKEPLLKAAFELNDRFKNEKHPAVAVNIVLVDSEDLDEKTVIPDQFQPDYKGFWDYYKKNSPSMKGVGKTRGVFFGQGYYGTRPEDSFYDTKENKTVSSSKELPHLTYTIFLAVGGTFRPRPGASHPGVGNLGNPAGLTTEELTNESQLRKAGYIYLPINYRTAGLNLRHEFRHFLFNDELKTEVSFLKDYIEAYQAFDQRGDNTGYYFVFTTPEGPVYTRGEEKELAA